MNTFIYTQQSRASTYGSANYRSGSREKSYSRLNLKSREDPKIKQRLVNLMESAQTYKTKACGVQRNPMASASGMDNTRVIIERRRKSYGGYKPPQKIAMSPKSPTMGYLSRERSSSYTRNINIQPMALSTRRSNELSTSRKKITNLRSNTAAMNITSNTNTLLSTNRSSSRGYPVPHSQRSTKVASPKTQSLKTFTKDAEFIEFLKSISIYVTDEYGNIGIGEDTSRSSNNLYKNLELLR